ncbi:leucyl aminopeptidase [Aneurinibacillus sp. Ricciae_BoGa-3]|uniref:leucyl aminopeptidase n=1 Tax=Aneurinibacillus sp. Ricciae_BoGa-3 TaxID=3022697 RepID=UPI00234178E3|nr:leucyl aminopeptidase [Aneurinibacillus sp. Ricciae_BoGa-3]WCK53766.1 leucyl aminopeptidase [Aneurinibacillus sp. Ricciae_BoGa-3]
MEIKVVTKGLLTQQADCLVIGIVKGTIKAEGALAEADQALGGNIAALFSDSEISGDRNDTQFIHTYGKIAARRILLVGLGDEAELSFEELREASARAVKEALKAKLTKLAFALSDAWSGLDAKEASHAITEGVLLADYRFPGYHQKEELKPALESLVIFCAEQGAEDAREGVRIGQAFAEGTNLARDLVNMPGNYLTPTVLAEKAKEVAERYGMEVEILEKPDMERYGMGGLLGVNQGSVQAPKLVAIKYQGTDKWEDVLGFVGKGITFDSGGISLKPGPGMDEMKGDMGGAAAVIGALEVIGRLKPDVNIAAVIPTTDNMPSGSALKPGDVITAMNGKTIEILNTDAEGRLILADGVCYAKEMGADYVVDLATLTGAALVALGTCTTAAVTNNEEFMEEVMISAAEAGELLWRLPAYKPYKDQIKSKIADLKNTGGRNAGSITAGLFVGEFAEETPWVHLDIAGTSWADKDNDLSPAGGTGVMVRTLATLAQLRSVNEKEE